MYAELKSDIHIFGFQLECSSFDKLARKSQYCFLKVKFGNKANWNIQNSMMIFTFSVLDQKCRFSTNFAQNIKFLS